MEIVFRQMNRTSALKCRTSNTDLIRGSDHRFVAPRLSIGSACAECHGILRDRELSASLCGDSETGDRSVWQWRSAHRRAIEPGHELSSHIRFEIAGQRGPLYGIARESYHLRKTISIDGHDLGAIKKGLRIRACLDWRAGDDRREDAQRERNFVHGG